MAVLPRELADNPNVLTEEQFGALLEKRAQEWLGMSLDEFVDRRDNGTLPSSPAVDHLLLLLGARTGEE